jgi:hypothetical protein
MAYHSAGGMTLTIPDFIPCLSILSMKRLKLQNWSIVCTDDGQNHVTSFARIPFPEYERAIYRNSKRDHVQDCDVPA